MSSFAILGEDADGWQTVSAPSKAKKQAEQKQKQAASSQASNASNKPYSPFDPSTWAKPKASAPVKKKKEGKKAAPVPKLPDPEEEEEKTKTKKVKVKKVKDERGAIVESIEKILLHQARGRYLLVSEVGEALSKAMGIPSWNKKFKPMYGSLKAFLEKYPDQFLVETRDSEDRVYLKKVLAEREEEEDDDDDEEDEDEAASGKKTRGLCRCGPCSLLVLGVLGAGIGVLFHLDRNLDTPSVALAMLLKGW